MTDTPLTDAEICGLEAVARRHRKRGDNITAAAVERAIAEIRSHHAVPVPAGVGREDVARTIRQVLNDHGWQAVTAHTLPEVIADALLSAPSVGDSSAQVQTSGQETAGASSDELADVLVMTACKGRAELEDMANIGRSFMESLDYVVTKSEGPFKGWSPADDPAELVIDMLNALDEALDAPVAEGFVLVPVEPTEAMLGAACIALKEVTRDSQKRRVTRYPPVALVNDAYAAMLAAAPHPGKGEG